MKKKIFYLLAIILIILIAAGVYFINPFANKIKSGLQVTVQDIPVSLFLNDQYLEKAPYINNQIMPGNYQLRIVPDDPDLASYELPITLNQGFLTVVIWRPGPTADSSGGVVYELEPLPGKKQTEVSIISNPDSALVTFGDYGEYFTPVVIKDVEPKDHNFEISLVSFDSKRHTVRVIEGHRLNIFAKLPKSIRAQEGDSSLYEQTNGVDEASSKDSLDGDELPAGPAIKINSTNFFQAGVEVLRVRETPSLNSEPIGFVAVDNTYEFVEESDNWYLIEFKDPTDNQVKQGWVSGDYVELINVDIKEPLE